MERTNMAACSGNGYSLFALAGPFFRRFGFRDLVGQLAELVGRNQIVIDHADEKVLDRAATEAIDNAADLLVGDAVRLDTGAVDVGPALDVVLDVAFLFQPPQDRT